MTITQDTARYSSLPSSSAVTSGPSFSGLDILGAIVAIVMLLGPLTAAGTHYSHQGWPAEQTAEK